MKYQNLLQSLAKLMASISLFSFLFSYNQYSLNSPFSTFPFQLLSHDMDKNYVFLICNGIFLVVLANTSSEEQEKEEEEDEKEKAEEDGFLNEFQEAELLPLCIGAHASYFETSKEEVYVQCDEEVSMQLSKTHELPLNVENSIMTIVEYKQDGATSEVQVLDEEKEEGGIGGEECPEKEEGGIGGEEFPEKEEGGIGGEECPRTYEIVEEDHCEENDFLIEEEEGEEIDEPLNRLSTEELNKKFEEFIRKMKEEIRFEARHQLVLVK